MRPNAIALIAALPLLALPASADQPVSSGGSATHTQIKDCDTRGRDFDPFSLAFVLEGVEGSSATKADLRCNFTTIGGAKGGKGMKISFDGQILDMNGSPVAPIGTVSDRVDRRGGASIDLDILGLDSDEDYLIGLEVELAANKRARGVQANCSATFRQPCQAGKETLCLLDDDRFKVEVDWRTSNQSGRGQVLSAGQNDGLFYFFNPNTNQNLLVQLLNRCRFNDHFWVFAAAQTNVEFDLTVTDTETGQTRAYSNPLGQQFQAITDTAAFATCP